MWTRVCIQTGVSLQLLALSLFAAGEPMPNSSDDSKIRLENQNMRLLLKTRLLRPHSYLGPLPLFWRTEVPLFWILARFQAVSGQECRYPPHYPIKMVIYSTIVAPESAARALTHDSVEIAAAVSAKSIFVQGIFTSRGQTFDAKFDHDLACLRLHTRPS
ncbi:hypothetical protein ASF12_17610 [Paenibacillus sp. Leaf72]|nr:hypothetical protein ASF12_17610 [Paenibacillus sp. Leaf72]